MFGLARKKATEAARVSEPLTNPDAEQTLTLRPNGSVFPVDPMQLWMSKTPKRIRVVIGDDVVADSSDVIMLHERGYTPVYYFPRQDIRADLLPMISGDKSHCPHKGIARYLTVADGMYAGGRVAWSYERPTKKAADIAGRIAFYWDRVDHWFEDGTELVGSPPDPFVRIEIKSADARLKVVHQGVVLTDTDKALVLYETGLMPRYYVPEADIRAKLELSETKTVCTYKGAADYAHIVTDAFRVDDGVFGYLQPVHESLPLKGHWSLWFEKFDATYLGGVRLLPPPPRTDGQPVLTRGDKLGPVSGAT